LVQSLVHVSASQGNAINTTGHILDEACYDAFLFPSLETCRTCYRAIAQFVYSGGALPDVDAIRDSLPQTLREWSFQVCAESAGNWYTRADYNSILSIFLRASTDGVSYDDAIALALGFCDTGAGFATGQIGRASCRERV